MSELVRAGAPLVALLVDHSGSMSTCRAEMETGLNDFIAEQASLPGEAALMLADFDHEYVIQWPMQALSRPVPRYSLQPRGKTALFDAIGSYIGDINEVLSHETVHRPVVVCIVTDGHENGSREWDRSTVKAWIAHQQDEYGWTFVFLGANLNAVDEANRFGIPLQHALTFDTGHGKATYRLLGRHVRDVREGRDAQFTPDDRRKAIGQ